MPNSRGIQCFLIEKEIKDHDFAVAWSKYGTNMTRRDVLESAGALAAFGDARLLLGAGARMFISLNGSLVGRDTPAFEWPGFARLAARVGYGGVDLNLQAAMKEGVGATRALLTELKIKPGFSGFSAPLFGRDEAAFQSSLAKLPETAQFCAALSRRSQSGADRPHTEKYAA
jgi:hypothetical protein